MSTMALRIGEVAQRVGVTPRTIRYYEEIGLLPNAPDRPSGGHRLYTQEEVERLREVIRLKELLGVTLDELRDLLTAEEARAAVRAELQREDVHPLEEALGFKSLLELGQPYSIAHIAARAGKSEAYIYGRLKLADLIPPVAEAFLKDQITIGHALLIAKLPASQQQEAFAAKLRPGKFIERAGAKMIIKIANSFG